MATPLHQPKPERVYLRDGVVHIESLTATDPDLVSLVEAAADPTAVVREALALGGRVLRVARGSLDARAVEHAFAAMSERLDIRLSQVGDRFEQTTVELLGADGERGALYRLLGQWRKEVEQLLEQTFDETSKQSALAKLEQILDNAASIQLFELRQLIDPDNQLSPLARWRSEIVAELARQGQEIEHALNDLATKVAVDRAVATTFERTAVKGAKFEDAVYQVLQQLAAPRGDVVEQTRNETGVRGNRVGDAVVRLNPDDTGGHAAAYVVEVKDKPLPTAKALDELAEALRNRQALAGIIVFSSDEHCPEPEPVNFFGDAVLVVLDKHNPDPTPLRLATLFARQRVRDRVTADQRPPLDAERIADLVATARRSLSRIRAIKKNQGSARNCIEAAQQHVDELKEELDVLLDQIEDATRSPTT